MDLSKRETEMTNDYDNSFILNFTDGREGVRSLDFDTLEAAQHLMTICNRPSFIREVGNNSFSQTSIDRVRVVME